MADTMMRKLSLVAADLLTAALVFLLPGWLSMGAFWLQPAEAKGGGKANRLKGLRAITIQTPSFPATLVPGDKVDVFLTVNDKGGLGISILVANVEIWAVDTPVASKGHARPMQSVTLLVTPAQAVKLDQAPWKSTLYLALRQPKPIRKRTPARQPAPKPAPEQALVPEIRLLRGGYLGDPPASGGYGRRVRLFPPAA